jgi:hypothetical protein
MNRMCALTLGIAIVSAALPSCGDEATGPVRQ